MSLGRAMAGGTGKAGRRKHDFYPTTDAPMVRALLPHLQGIFPTQIWEPACGQGHMVEELRKVDYTVTCSDIVDRGYGGTIVEDFLTTSRARAPAIITNPPFSLADAFIEHALCVLGIEHLALILPMNFYTAKKRVQAFETFKPSLVMPMTWRLDTTGQGAPTMNLQWVVWSSNLLPVQGFLPLANPGE